MFSARRPSFSAIFGFHRSSPRKRGPSLDSRLRGNERSWLLRRSQIRPHLVEQLFHLAAFEFGDVVLIFQQHAERVGDGGGIERDDVELRERRRPVERLGNTGRFEQFLLAQALHESDYLLRQLLADAWHLGAYD